MLRNIGNRCIQSTLPKNEEGFAKFYAIAVLQGLEVPDRRSIDSRERLRCKVTQDVTGSGDAILNY
jgi:hypothetical protein